MKPEAKQADVEGSKLTTKKNQELTVEIESRSEKLKKSTRNDETVENDYE